MKLTLGLILTMFLLQSCGGGKDNRVNFISGAQDKTSQEALDLVDGNWCLSFSGTDEAGNDIYFESVIKFTENGRVRFRANTNGKVSDDTGLWSLSSNGRLLRTKSLDPNDSEIESQEVSITSYELIFFDAIEYEDGTKDDMVFSKCD